MGDGMHVVMLPWLAFGHTIPFLHLSIALAKSGIRISFLTPPRNIQRLPKIPPHLTALINLVELPLPAVDGLPEGAEATIDIQHGSDEYLKKAYDLSYPTFEQFIAAQSPDWIIHDLFPSWTSKISREFGIPHVLFSAFSAAVMAFIGPLESAMIGDDLRKLWPSPESLATQPKWFEFDSSIAFRPHETDGVYRSFFSPNASGLSDLDHVLLALQGCSAMAIRTCTEFEGEYLSLLPKLYKIPVIPVGLFPPALPDKRETTDPKWATTLKWLDDRPTRSVVYVCFGSECKLSSDQVYEIAHGLELSNLPFLWALRSPISSTDDVDTLPSGFESRIGSRGIVHLGWVPQLEILAHPSIGGYFFHAGWGSIIETVQYGHAMVVLPLANIQPLDARHMVDKGLAIQVEINNDGSFHRDAISQSLRRAMVEEGGERIRLKSMEMSAVFRDQKLHQSYVNGFISFLKSS
ncbi:putative UDP-rhamnose:rhamnosyltransferase 1 [Magnolia sinica]|uniref:putative UDP-rhamnose:rhamnosyltransferase 1 n=1 Tax=Magnolia sinica TaxID=86752 RepID=UPI002657C29F|nr:putative UDP-rhamnose:rhamnosyltransferase 1 [Magnolia sinica]